METAIINVRIDGELKESAQSFAKDIGTSLSSLVTMLLQDAVRKKSVTFTAPSYKMTPYLESEIAKNKEAGESGVHMKFKNGEESIEYFKKFAREHHGIAV